MNDKIQLVIESAINDHIFPGAVVGYAMPDNIQILPFGHITYDKNSARVTENTVYDLASITKVIPTNTLIWNLIERGLLSTEDQVIKFIPEIENAYREKILVRHLLTFTYAIDQSHALKGYIDQGANAMLKVLFTAPLLFPPGKQYHYSNIPSMLLGMIAERILNKPLDKIADELLFIPLGMNSTTFHPDQLHNAVMAPTEINDRGEVHGQVHDETAWALYKEGVVSGHAGLFSNAKDLLTFGQMLLAKGEYNRKRFFKPHTIAKMTTEIQNDGKFGMTLGWETSQSDYMSPAISPMAYGKDGFTGTLILIEPDKQSCLVLLTNRTYPKRPENSAEINKVRRIIQEIVFG